MSTTEPDRQTRRPAPRYSLSEPAAMADEQRALYEKIANGPRKAQKGQVALTDDRGRLLGPFGLMTIAPSTGDAIQAVGAALRFGTQMSARTREVAILVVASHFSSDFEWFAHEPAARAAGITEEQLSVLKNSEVPTGLGLDEQTAARAVLAMLERHTLDDSEYKNTVAVLGDQTLAELVWLCGYYSMLALSLNVFDPENPLLTGQKIF